MASYPLTDSYHSMNEEVTPYIEPLTDGGPKPPPPPPGSLIKNDSLKSNEDLYPPLPPTAELGSYNTQPVDHLHMQESYAYSELDSLKKEIEDLKNELGKSKALVDRLQAENRRLVAENTVLQGGGHGNPMLMQGDIQNGMAPIPVQSTSSGYRKPSELVPKGSGTY